MFCCICVMAIVWVSSDFIVCPISVLCWGRVCIVPFLYWLMCLFLLLEMLLFCFAHIWCVAVGTRYFVYIRVFVGMCCFGDLLMLLLLCIEYGPDVFSKHLNDPVSSCFYVWQCCCFLFLIVFLCVMYSWLLLYGMYY